MQTFDNLREGNVCLDISDLDSNTFALFGIGNYDDEAALDTGNAVALLADIFDFDSPLLSLFNGRRLWSMRGLGFRVGPTGSIRCRCGQHSYTIRLTGLEITTLNLLFWDFDNRRAVAFLDRRREQTTKLVRNIHQS